MRKLVAACLMALAVFPASRSFAVGPVVIFVPMPPPDVVPNPIIGALDNIHSVAVLSSIGSQFNLYNHHVIYYHDWSVGIADWAIDDRVEANLRGTLGKRFAVKDINYDRNALAAIPNGRWDNSKTPLQRYLSGLANAGVDAFIVVRPDVEGTVTGKPGLALWTEYGVSSHAPELTANYEIDIVDAHSLALISKAFSRLDDIPGNEGRVAHLSYGDDLAVADEATPPPPVYARLKQASTSLVDRSLAATLRALQFDVPVAGPQPKAFVPIPAGQDPYAPARSIAVISTLGDDLALVREDEGLFRGPETPMHSSVSDWKLDAAIEARIKSGVAKRFAVKDVPYDRQRLLWSNITGPKNTFAPYFPGLQASSDVDLYAVVFKVKMQVWDQNTGYGLGLVNDDDKMARIFANYGIAIIDAHTLKPLGILYGMPDTMLADAAVGAEIPVSLWPAVPPDFEAAQGGKVREAILSLLSGSLDATLKRGGLTGEMLPGNPPVLALGPPARLAPAVGNPF